MITCPRSRQQDQSASQQAALVGFSGFLPTTKRRGHEVGKGRYWGYLRGDREELGAPGKRRRRSKDTYDQDALFTCIKFSKCK